MKNSISRYRVISKAEIEAYEKNTANREIAGEQKPTEDSYIEKVKKYIPVEIVGSYLFLHKLIEDNATSQNGVKPQILFGIILIICLVLTPLYKFFQVKHDDLPVPVRQAIISTFAFIVWSFYLGGWFQHVFGTYYDNTIAMILLVTFTLITPLIENWKYHIKSESKLRYCC